MAAIAFLSDSLASIDQWNEEIAETIDTLNNFLKQRASVDSIPKECQLLKRHPTWREQIMSRLDLLLTDIIVEFQHYILGTKLNPLKKYLDIILAETDEKYSHRFSASFIEDLQTLHEHISDLLDYYTSAIDKLRPEFLDKNAKNSDSVMIKLRKFVDTYECAKGVGRLKEDLKTLFVMALGPSEARPQANHFTSGGDLDRHKRQADQFTSGTIVQPWGGDLVYFGRKRRQADLFTSGTIVQPWGGGLNYFNGYGFFGRR
ncbi:hypothetical protein Ddc_03235 [Ditylenchus destructor]|nr:hypothetical protein Ddc_03235 [Ditylenchus destructor]